MRFPHALAFLVACPLIQACSSAPAEQANVSDVEASTFELIRLEFLAADELAKTLADFLQQASTPATSPAEVYAETSTNSILVKAGPARLAEIKNLIAALDVEAKPQR